MVPFVITVSFEEVLTSVVFVFLFGWVFRVTVHVITVDVVSENI